VGLDPQESFAEMHEDGGVEDTVVMRTSPPTIHPRLHKIMLLLALLLVPVLVNLIIK
jgi:hypothetical protein